MTGKLNVSKVLIFVLWASGPNPISFKVTPVTTSLTRALVHGAMQAYSSGGGFPVSSKRNSRPVGGYESEITGALLG